MSAPKDVKIALTVQQMASYGYFNEEFLLYCFAYRENGKTIYKVSENQESIYSHYAQCIWDNKYPTPIHSLLKSTVVLSGERQRFKSQFKLELVEKIRSMYGDNFFNAIELFKNTKNNEFAYDLLHEFLEENIHSTYCSIPETIQLFNGLAKLALEAKQISHSSYNELNNYIKRIYGEIEEQHSPLSGQGKQLSCFAYWDMVSNTPKYYFSAIMGNTLQKYYEVHSKGKFCTPIIYKNYWFNTANKYQQIKNEFSVLVKTLFDEYHIFEMVMQIKSFNPSINQMHFDVLMNDLSNFATSETLSAIQEYGFRCNLID